MAERGNKLESNLPVQLSEYHHNKTRLLKAEKEAANGKATQTIHAVEYANDRFKFTEECNALTKLGYKLHSSSCSSHGFDGGIDTTYQAIFVLDNEVVK